MCHQVLAAGKNRLIYHYIIWNQMEDLLQDLGGVLITSRPLDVTYLMPIYFDMRHKQDRIIRGTDHPIVEIRSKEKSVDEWRSVFEP